MSPSPLLVIKRFLDTRKLNVFLNVPRHSVDSQPYECIDIRDMKGHKVLITAILVGPQGYIKFPSIFELKTHLMHLK